MEELGTISSSDRVNAPGQAVMSETLQEILDTRAVATPRGETLPLRDEVTQEEGEFLQSLVSDLRPRASLEIGLAFGVSALFICDALAAAGGGRHTAIDPLQSELWQNAGRYAVERAGHAEMFDLIEEPSELALPRLVAEGRRFDFAFIDGAHQFDQALVDFFYVDRLLKPGGVVAFDDAPLPSVYRVCRYVLANRSYTVRACLAADGATSRGHRLARRLNLIPGMRRLLKPSLVVADEALGIIPGSRCIALTKEGEDDRPWDFHAEF